MTDFRTSVNDMYQDHHVARKDHHTLLSMYTTLDSVSHNHQFDRRRISSLRRSINKNLMNAEQRSQTLKDSAECTLHTMQTRHDAEINQLHEKYNQQLMASKSSARSAYVMCCIIAYMALWVFMGTTPVGMGGC
jgi:pyruvate/2-oxoglutarate dehydrogenase complex dihydrolipoamide acyltransferase (E2) component